MRRRSGNGKKVTGVEFGFICCQAFALMMLFSIVIYGIIAKNTFKGGIEFLPVTITWTQSKDYETTYMEDGKTRTKTEYDNYYSYTVDGVEYSDAEYNASYGVTPGAQDIRYYNPKDPSQISFYQSFWNQMAETKTICIFFIILQIAAIIFKVKVEQKKRKIKDDRVSYEEKIRQDVEKNREVYETLDLAIDKEKVFTVLEPLRVRIDKNQKSIDKIMKRQGVAVGGIFFPITIAVHLVDSIRLNKLRGKLDEDSAAFDLEYKRNIAEPILREFFEEFQYQPSQGFSKEQLSEFKLLDGFTRRLNYVTSEDYIEGSYKGVAYRQADIKEKMRLDESELLSETSRLHGRVSVYEFKKRLDAEIIIKSEGSTNVLVYNMKKVEMENTLFNSKFQVYTTNEQMAYYLLTPQFMEYLLDLNVRRETAFRFYGNQIVFLQNGINGIFEADMSRTLDMQYEIGKSYNELKDILSFVDVLNLDRVADEANLRAAYISEEETEEVPPVMEESKTTYGVVDEEDSIFGGPSFEDAEQTEETYEDDELANWNKPVPNTSKSGLRLKQ